FFSSRRRHTRCLSDWSSDVCSSDLRRHWSLMKVFQRFGRVDERPAQGTDQIHSGHRIQEQLVFPTSCLENVPSHHGSNKPGKIRSEERRVGKECRTRWMTDE